MATPSFRVLSDVHEWLDELFLQHQLALLALDLDGARERLDEYERQLLVHIADEDGTLVPLYDARTRDVPGGHRDFFVGEHVKLQALVDDCRRRLDALASLDGEPRRRAAIALFDREAFLKTYVEHHHAREQNILFPWLDTVTTEAERLSLIAGCRSLAACRAARPAAE